ncbi:MAG: hypothetical protein ACRC33_29280 [Gemmataceae bacterium]
MDWLYEGRLTVYLALALAAGAFLALWVRDRKGRWLLALAVPLLLAGAYLLLDRLVETRGEQIGRKLHEMAAAVEARDAGRIAAHLSPTFKYGAENREGFRRFAEQFLRDRRVDSLTVWDVQPDPADPQGVTLKAKPRGGIAAGAEAYFFVKTRWARDPDGQWRLTGFSVHNPYADSATPIDVMRYR